MIRYILSLLSLLLMLCHCSKAPYFEKGEHITNPALDALAGDWVGVSGNDTLRLSLEKHTRHLEAIDVYVDVLDGLLKYNHLDWTDYYTSSDLTCRFVDASSSVYCNLYNSKWWKPRQFSFRLITGQLHTGSLKVNFSKEISAWLPIHLSEDKPKEENNPIPTPSTWIMSRITLGN